MPAARCDGGGSDCRVIIYDYDDYGGGGGGGGGGPRRAVFRSRYVSTTRRGRAEEDRPPRTEEYREKNEKIDNGTQSIVHDALCESVLRFFYRTLFFFSLPSLFCDYNTDEHAHGGGGGGTYVRDLRRRRRAM